MPNLALNLSATVRTRPDSVALRLDEQSLTYRELDDLVDRVVDLLAEQGVQAGDRVAVMLPNVLDFAVIFYAALRRGAVVVPMNPLFKEREVEYYLRDSGARVLFAFDQVAEAARAGAASTDAQVIEVPATGLAHTLPAASVEHEPHPREDGDTAVILYTSGTTGQPKGAQLTHANLQTNQDLTARTLLALEPGQVVMGCLPLFHVFGLTCALNTTVATGACLTLIPRFDPARAMEVIERDGVSVFLGVPTMYAAMLNHPDAERRTLSSLRLCISGGSAMPVEVMHAFERRFGCMILEGYGLSETSPVASFNHPHAERKPGSIGFPVEGARMRLVDSAGGEITAPDSVGEIQIHGLGVMAGYWQRPEDSARAIDADGWFSSGDLARLDADGYYYIVDRTKDVIIRGGLNVYPREVEELLYEHPAVAEAAVIGVPHDELGEEVAAAVALKPGASATPDELRDFVKERLAAYKYPRRVWLVDQLPKTATGKILRREVSPPR